MTEPFADLAGLRRLCLALPEGDADAAAAARSRQATLTKPPGSLGRLEELACWLGRWQGRMLPRLDRVEILVFAGNHGATAHGISPYPAAVTAQMVANFAAGGAAINQLARMAEAHLRVIPMAELAACGDFSLAPAMTEAAFLACVGTGFAAVAPGTDLLCVGEMGIGNTTAAAALSAALFGGAGSDWAGRGTGHDDAGLGRKIRTVDAALALHGAALDDPLEAARHVGGHELAAILGAVLAARLHRVPVLLDGYVSTAAAAPLRRLNPAGLDHALVSHRSAEAAHAALAAALGQVPLLDLGMRLGEASGAALAVPMLRAACACHAGMASFHEAGVSNRT